MKLATTIRMIMGMAALTGCASTRSSLDRFEYSRLLMGVEARVTLYADDEATAIDATRAAFERIAELEAVMSDYRAGSELNRLCDHAGGAPVEVSADLFRVLEVANEVSERSNGAFDVTVKPLVELWREARRTKRLPDPKELEAARAIVGWRRVHLDRNLHTVALEFRTRLDLGGVAKGDACEQALRVLRERGIESAMIEMGGDIALGDAPPGRAGWKILVARDGDGDEQGRVREARIVLLANMCVSTSGGSEQYVEIDGVRYAHIVDPRTGLGATRDLNATVTCVEGAKADAWSTAIALLGVGENVERIANAVGVRIVVWH